MAYNNNNAANQRRDVLVQAMQSLNKCYTLSEGPITESKLRRAVALCQFILRINSRHFATETGLMDDPVLSNLRVFRDQDGHADMIKQLEAINNESRSQVDSRNPRARNDNRLRFHMYEKRQVSGMMLRAIGVEGNRELKYFNIAHCHWILGLLAAVSTHELTRDEEVIQFSFGDDSFGADDDNLTYRDALTVLNMVSSFHLNTSEDIDDVMGSMGCGVLFLRACARPPVNFTLTFHHVVNEYILSAAHVLLFLIQMKVIALRMGGSDIEKRCLNSVNTLIRRIINNHVFTNLTTIFESLTTTFGISQFYASLEFIRILLNENETRDFLLQDEHEASTGEAIIDSFYDEMAESDTNFGLLIIPKCSANDDIEANNVLLDERTLQSRAWYDTYASKDGPILRYLDELTHRADHATLSELRTKMIRLCTVEEYTRLNDETAKFLIGKGQGIHRMDPLAYVFVGRMLMLMETIFGSNISLLNEWKDTVLAKHLRETSAETVKGAPFLRGALNWAGVPDMGFSEEDMEFLSSKGGIFLVCEILRTRVNPKIERNVQNYFICLST